MKNTAKSDAMRQNANLIYQRRWIRVEQVKLCVTSKGPTQKQTVSKTIYDIKYVMYETSNETLDGVGGGVA